MGEPVFDYDILAKRIIGLAESKGVEVTDEQLSIFFEAEYEYMKELGIAE
ncbi:MULTISPECIES: hypothetical protein [Bacillus subtilis group]|nr:MULTISPECIES: hypothetical protein [Bacillus subtilis group]MCY8228676.1 hypothetical protein [Bacillus spizizenii]MEC2335096.1 hypothetical protein [Bacillus subtilis]